MGRLGIHGTVRILLLAGWAAMAMGRADAVPEGYQLLWSDEFQQDEASVPDPQKWSYTLRKDNQDEVQVYTSTTKNASVIADPLALDGKALRIQAVKEEDGTLTSARISTREKYTFKYGWVECRARLPYGQGMWPAFWMMGDTLGSVWWPDCGEVDVMEAIGKEPAVNHGSVHGPGYTGGKFGGAYTLPDGQAFKDGYHTFAIEWTKDFIKFYVDDSPYKTFTADDLEGSKWVFDHDFYLILQLALGGGWSGAPDDTTEFPQSLLVDYVRVYQKKAD